MKDLHEEAGKFKTLENAIIGADFETAKPYLVPTLLKDMCDDLYYKLEKSKNEEEKIKAILESHIHFEKIHPFGDGNGRTGRLLIVYSCLENNLTPIIIPKEEKSYYISYLRTNKVDEELIDFIKKIQKKEQQRIEKFKLIQNQNPHNETKQENLSLKEVNAMLDEATKEQSLRASQSKPNYEEQENPKQKNRKKR